MGTGQNEPRTDADERGCSAEAALVPPIGYDTTPSWRRIGELWLGYVGWFVLGAFASVFAWIVAMQPVTLFILWLPPILNYTLYSLLLATPSIAGIAAAWMAWRSPSARERLEAYNLVHESWAFLLGWNLAALGTLGFILSC